MSAATSAPLDIPLHVKYIQNLDKKKDLAYHLTEHLRVNGVYWGLTALCIMGHPDALPREEMIDYVLGCWDEEAGTFGAHPGHDGHILGTLSAIQILVIQDALDRANTDRIAQFLISLIQPDGQVAGDQFGETDSRFTYILLNALSLMGRLSDLDAVPGRREAIIDNLRRCMNFDAGFGTTPGAESHGGQSEFASEDLTSPHPHPHPRQHARSQEKRRVKRVVGVDQAVWVCLAALAILDRLDIVDTDTLAAWLSERQLPSGGLNGRPEKLEDVCYSWWDLASLSILGRLHWINRDKLIGFILDSQDLEEGGIGDRPGDWVDVFHTVFGAAGLSLVGYPGLQDVDPVYCMPADLIRRLGLSKTYATLPRLTTWPEQPAPAST